MSPFISFCISSAYFILLQISVEVDDNFIMVENDGELHIIYSKLLASHIFFIQSFHFI